MILSIIVVSTSLSKAQSSLKNTLPANNQKLSSVEAGKPLTFSWTPIIPKPQTSVSYKLKVWQVMKGQTAAMVVRANKPKVNRDAKQATQFVKSNLLGDVENINGSAELVWSVDAVDDKGKVVSSSPTSNLRIIFPPNK